MHIKDLVREAHEIAVEKGWWDEEFKPNGYPRNVGLTPRNFGEIIALCHSELTEALECWRDGWNPEYIKIGGDGKPEGVPIELADCVIRIADWCGYQGVDLQAALRLKMDFNRTRPVRHGGKIA